MEELLLPSSREEPQRDHSSRRTMGDQLKTFLEVMLSRELTRNIKDFCKKNGLLTLSVIAVVTGCMLGFMLRGTQMSTQVGPGLADRQHPTGRVKM